MPDVLPQNKEVWNIYLKARSQVIMGMNGPVSLDIRALKYIMDLYEVEDQRTVSEQVINLWETIRSDEIAIQRVKK